MTADDTIAKIVPAEPGWRVCEPIVDIDNDDVDELQELEVIAWVITYIFDAGDAHVKAVTVDDGVFGEDAIHKSPSGRYFTPNGKDFDTRKRAFDFARERRRREVEEQISS